MSAIYNIFKTIYLNSNKGSKKNIFSNSTNNKSCIRNSNYAVLKNISLIKPKSILTKKKPIKKNYSKNETIFEKMKFYYPIKSKNKNGKINNGRNYLLYSPNNKSNNLRKKLMMTTYSNSNSINLSKASKEPKIQTKIKNDNKILLNYKKEKNKFSNLIEKQKIEIEKLKNKKQIYREKLILLEKEKKLLNNQIEEYHSNQEQLILLIKLIQNCGVDIDKLIDDYNNNIDDYNNENNSKKNSDSLSLSELDLKVDSNSFIPITIEKSHKTKISKINIPKLNLAKIKKNK